MPGCVSGVPRDSRTIRSHETGKSSPAVRVPMGYYVMSVESGGSWLDGRRLPRGVWLPLRNGSELCVGQVYLCVVLLVALVVCLCVVFVRGVLLCCVSLCGAWCVGLWCVMCVVFVVCCCVVCHVCGAWCASAREFVLVGCVGYQCALCARLIRPLLLNHRLRILPTRACTDFKWLKLVSRGHKYGRRGGGGGESRYGGRTTDGHIK